jgi:RimJ/RimL family protein N-acetyltransferase
MRVIKIERLTLEPQTAAHAAEMFVVLSDPAIYAHENQPPPSLEWLRNRFTKLETRLSADGREQWLNWVIRLPTSELIGYVQATIREDGRAAIAYELASAYWSRGLGHQAVGAMISELIERYEVRTLFAMLVSENLRSRRLLERLGLSLASPEQHAVHRVAPGEILMHREVPAAEAAAEATAVKLDVFGKRMLVERSEAAWRTYLLGADGKRSLVHVAIPPSVTEDELLQYFDDLYHEAATPQRPAVVRLR